MHLLIHGLSSGTGDYVQWMIDFSEDSSHGYGWNSATNSWSNATHYANSTGKHREGLTGNPDVICSTFVWLALKENGYKVPDYPFQVGNMADDLESNGFIKKDFSEDELKRGDIVEYRNSGGNHVEVYIGNGEYVGAREDTNKKLGESSNNEVFVMKGAIVPYQYMWQKE